MKKYECYMIQAEIKHPWLDKWERKGETFKNLKDLKKVLKSLKEPKNKDVVRNVRIFKMAPYEELDL